MYNQNAPQKAELIYIYLAMEELTLSQLCAAQYILNRIKCTIW
jgi:hypothetical protein